MKCCLGNILLSCGSFRFFQFSGGVLPDNQSTSIGRSSGSFGELNLLLRKLYDINSNSSSIFCVVFILYCNFTPYIALIQPCLQWSSPTAPRSSPNCFLLSASFALRTLTTMSFSFTFNCSKWSILSWISLPVMSVWLPVKICSWDRQFTYLVWNIIPSLIIRNWHM